MIFAVKFEEPFPSCVALSPSEVRFLAPGEVFFQLFDRPEYITLDKLVNDSDSRASLITICIYCQSFHSE